MKALFQSSPRRINLNHAQAQKPTVAGYILLTAGIVLSCLAIYTVSHLHKQANTLQQQVDSLLHPDSRAKPVVLAKMNPGERDEKNAVDAAVQSLFIPWQPLFSMLENMQVPQVKIISIEPNARQHKLKITAESATLESMLEYVASLDRQSMLRDVFLVTHEQAVDGRAMPYTFAIEAAWLN